MPFSHAGIFSGRFNPGVYTVYEEGTRTPATLYTDASKDTALANSSVATDDGGNVVFYADPALYTVLAAASPQGVYQEPFTVSVPINPLDAGGGGAWGQASTAKYAGSGTPVGTVTPSGAGDLYVDDTTPALWQATGVADTDWQQVGSGTSVLFASYADTNSGSNPTLVLNSGIRHDADGVAVAIDGTNANQINILESGLYSVAVLGQIFPGGLTGGTVTVHVSGSLGDFYFDTEAGADSGEMDATVSFTLPLVAADILLINLFANGATASGCTVRAFITKTG